MQKVKLILNYTKVAKIALNVIAGVVNAHSVLSSVPIVFAKSNSQLLQAIKGALKEDQIPLVAWSFYSPGFMEYSEQLENVKQSITDKRVIHIAGGVHATAEPQQTLHAGFDYVAVGEGEQIIIDLLLALINTWKLEQIQGLWMIDQGRLIRNGRGRYVDLNDFPPFAQRFKRFNAIEITRGCIFACSFCQTPFVNKARFRHRSVDNICMYVKSMKEAGLKDYRFITPTSLSYGSMDETVNLHAIEELLARVRNTVGEKCNIYYGTFPSEIRPEHITVEALAVLKKYVDNKNIIIGGQSGSVSMLEKIHRGHDVEDIRRAVRLTIDAGLKPNVDFLFGLPDETKEDARLTRSLAQELADLGARIHSHTFMPLPGTPLKSSNAGVVDQQTQHSIRFLESTGKAYGQWKQQQKIAKELASLRRNI